MLSLHWLLPYISLQFVEIVFVGELLQLRPVHLTVLERPPGGDGGRVEQQPGLLDPD